MPDWKNASEAHPDDGCRVLVYTEHPMYGKEKTYVHDITIAEYWNGKWRCKEYLGNRVIAWTNLPDPPKEV